MLRYNYSSLLLVHRKFNNFSFKTIFLIYFSVTRECKKIKNSNWFVISACALLFWLICWPTIIWISKMQTYEDTDFFSKLEKKIDEGEIYIYFEVDNKNRIDSCILERFRANNFIAWSTKIFLWFILRIRLT